MDASDTRRRRKPRSLTRRTDFVRVQSCGRRFRRAHLTLLIDTGADSLPRVGYTVSRRVGSAVIRNRLRRRLREVTRLHQELLVGGFDYVIVGSAAAAPLLYEQLAEELVELLRAARRWVLAASGCSTDRG